MAPGFIDAIGPRDASRWLVEHLGLAAHRPERGPAGVRAMLDALGAVQLDPLDAIGTNADLVALARVRGIRKGDVYAAILPRHGFEHFAKERCLLPARAYPYYRDRAIETPWWRSGERAQRVAPDALEAVLSEVRARGPLAASELSDRGRVTPLDWSGWKGTSSAAKMALEMLWTRCAVVVAGRRGRDKVYDVPERALPDHHDARREEAFERWALLERVRGAGLLAETTSPSWSMLCHARGGRLVDEAIEDGKIERVRVAGRSTRYLAPAGFREARKRRLDDAMRILGPLDPLLWDRALVRQAFGVDYVWEVYKPAPLRRWGWYVCPLLHRGRLVGKLEAEIAGGTLVVKALWVEAGEALDEDALATALERHADACGADAVRFHARARRRRGSGVTSRRSPRSPAPARRRAR